MLDEEGLLLEGRAKAESGRRARSESIGGARAMALKRTGQDCFQENRSF